MLHLLKMCVGITSVGHLRDAQAKRLDALHDAGDPALLRHWTRHTPRRADEILDGGSIYWIIAGQIRARQRIIAIERNQAHGTNKRCALVLDSTVVETEPRGARPMQGWRYLNAADAPPDLKLGSDAPDDMPAKLVRELRALGLL